MISGLRRAVRSMPKIISIILTHLIVACTCQSDLLPAEPQRQDQPVA